MSTFSTQPQTGTRPTTSSSFLMKRKWVFRAREELRNSPSAAEFKEISLPTRTTAVCEPGTGAQEGLNRFSKYTSYSSHVNSQADSGHPARMLPQLQHCIDVCNNANNAEIKRKQLVERVIGKAITSRTMLLDLNQMKDKSSKAKEIGIKQSTTKYKIEGLQTSSKYDKIDKETEHRLARGSNLQTAEKSTRQESISFAPKLGRKDSVRPYDTKHPMMSKKSIVGKELQLNRFTLGETVEESGSDHDLATIANVHLTQREQALKLLAEIQVKMEKRQKTDDDDESGGRGSHPITPEEALQCAWLRLSKAQIATLEALIRQQGKDPGIHAHSDVTNYDVFAEIREIRNREKVLREEDEYKKQSKGTNLYPNKTMKE